MADSKNMSFEDQVKGMKDLASKVGGEIIDRVAPDSITALLKKAAAGELDTVMLADLERLASNPDERKEIIEKLKAYGVKIVEAAKTATYTRHTQK